MANQNPFSAIELFTSALRSNIIPNQEYLLQGSVIDSSAEVLHNRLRGKFPIFILKKFLLDICFF